MASIIFVDYILAALIIIAAIALALHAAKVPPVHTFRLIPDGLLIGSEFHPYRRMESFSILEHPEGETVPYLSIKTESWISPHLVIPLQDVDAEAVYLHFYERVPEGAHYHSFVDLFGFWLGF